jgi:hypothetical protein
MFLNETDKKHLKALEELNDVSSVWLLMTAEQSAALGHTPNRLADCILYGRITNTIWGGGELLTFHLSFGSLAGKFLHIVYTLRPCSLLFLCH